MVEFSSSVKNMRSSEIRRLMQLAADPSIISFSGGMPANSLFPIDVVDELYNQLSTQDKQAAMQYGPTGGYPPLLNSLKQYLESRGISTKNQGLIITTGAQQALNLVSKTFLNPHDIVITEYPSFVGAVAAFKSYEAELVGIELDNDGINIDKLEQVLESKKSQVKMLYINPCFQNPAGTTYSKEKKQKIIEIVKKYGICLLEDDPYSELYFDKSDKEVTIPIKSMSDDTLPICYAGTFAKIFGPGLRLGWLLAPTSIIDKCELAKQSMDACTSTFTQVLAHHYLQKGKLGPYLEWIRPIYARRAEIMLNALKKYMPEGVTWTTPKGGFYIWVTLPENMDSTTVFNESLKQGAAFVIGNAFDPYGVKNNSFRLAFSHTPEPRIDEGIKIVADSIKKLL